MARGTQGLLTLPINLWPAETRLLLGLIATWSVFGLLVLASASWWVSQQELGDAQRGSDEVLPHGLALCEVSRRF